MLLAFPGPTSANAANKTNPRRLANRRLLLRLHRLPLGKVTAEPAGGVHIPLCFWSLDSRWLDSGLIVLQSVPFVQKIRTTSACE
jgi:hypothetical protein